MSRPPYLLTQLLVAVCLVPAAVAAGAPGTEAPLSTATAFLESQQAGDGGFAERGRAPDTSLTSWGALALAAGGGSAEARARAVSFLRVHESDLATDTDVALDVLARVALGDRPDTLLARLHAHRPDAAVNATIWTVLALRAAGDAVPAQLTQALLRQQSPSGGWAWAAGGQPDSNDTAAAIQALAAVRVRGIPIRRGSAFLRGFQTPGGGFALTRGRAADAQSTAWAIQALLAAGVPVGKPAYRFLARLRRPDGSYRYSLAYATTPVWVTSQVVPALAGKPFPLPPS